MAAPSTDTFNGFPREALRFLSELERNNDRAWFQPRKADYEQYVRQPMFRLIESVNADLAKAAPDYRTEPAKAIYRIYRDTRFSANKTPYKTHIGALLWHKRLGKDGGAAIYFHLSTKEVLIAGGVYKPKPEVLLAIREHIASNHARLRAILKKKDLGQAMGELQGDILTRPPKGFQANHPAVDLLKRKDLLLEVILNPKIALKPEISRDLSRRILAMMPFVEFLNEPALKRRAKPRDPLFAD
jgi:uncharacterized protein (TIGR02453 family)